jgi:hypothetical protein
VEYGTREGVELPFESCNNDLGMGGRVILK